MYPTFNPNIIDVGSGFNVTNDTAPGFWQSLFAKWSRSGLTGAESAQNEFNAAEAERSREFSAQQAQSQMAFQSREAELARDWQEQMWNQYQSPEAMMRQYKEAGLNPALMYKGAGGGSVPSASSGQSGAMGSVVSASGSPLQATGAGLVDSLLSIVKLRSEIDNINADTASKNATSGLASAQTVAQDLSNDIARETKDVTIQTAFSNLDRLNNEVSKLSNEISEGLFNIENQEIRRGILLAEKELKKWQGEQVSAEAFMKKLEQSFYENKGWSTPPNILVPIISAALIGAPGLISKVIEKYGGRVKIGGFLKKR